MVWIYQIEHSLSRIDAFYDGLSPLRLAEPAEVSIQYITFKWLKVVIALTVTAFRSMARSPANS